jgi:hypothetical protein
LPQVTWAEKAWPEKAFDVLAATLGVLIAGVVGVYWWANTVPSRPKGVPTNAVFLWGPNVGFPGPRRGSWLACSEAAGHNRCTLSGIEGDIEYEGEFVPYGRKGSIPASQLKIDQTKTRENGVWVGETLVPLVYLKDGEVLIPASKYAEGALLLDQLKWSH